MRKALFLLVLLFLATTAASQIDEAASLTYRYVNPLIGTTGHHQSEYGGTIPGVTEPFGMTQWSPKTQENKIGAAVYHYAGKEIIGFTGTHQPAIWMGDYGYITIMPQLGELKVRSGERGLPFTHEQEEAHPHYYSVKMAAGDQQIQAEMAATSRCSFFRFSFPEAEEPKLLVEMSRLAGYEGYVEILPGKKQVVGYNADRQNEFYGKSMGPALRNFKGYFVLEFDTGFDAYGTYTDTSYAYTTSGDVKIYPARRKQPGEAVGAFISFPKGTRQVKVKIASSFISLEQAQQNLDKEIPHWKFEQTKKQCLDQWENYLQRMAVEGGSEDDKANFYTSIYHALLFPRVFSEYGNYYSAFDDSVHPGVSYNDYSLWDTFRALHPLLLLMAPEHVNPMITSLLQMYDEGGWLPKWPNPAYTNIMIGTHADAVIADAYVKDFRSFDAQKAYAAMYKNAMHPPEGDQQKRWADREGWYSYEARGGLSWYKTMGYVPADKTAESVSRTLEFAYDDFCVAQMAKALGKTEDYEYFLERSKNYRNVYNPKTGFMQPRLSDGPFFTGDPGKFRAFTEGSPWTYLFCVMQDIPGLIQLMGGERAFIGKLDENFKAGHYRHDNEPGHHYAYLYNYAGQPWKTQQLVNKIRAENYQNRPDGLSGNDDCGQMSAWYIFSAMGFYPVCPGSDEYALGAPLFSRITLQLDPEKPEKKLTIVTNGRSATNIYVKQARLNGKPLAKPFITHAEIRNGGLLEFEMTGRPEK